MTWEYRAVERVEREVAMYLDFEEDLTLDALRSFVTATEHLDGDSLVELEKRWRSGHDNVVVIVTRNKTTENLMPADHHECGPGCDAGNCAVTHAIEFGTVPDDPGRQHGDDLTDGMEVL